MDTEDGTMGQQELHHEHDDIGGFYSQFSGAVIVKIKACGYTNWFEELMEELGRKLIGGDQPRSGYWQHHMRIEDACGSLWRHKKKQNV